MLLLCLRLRFPVIQRFLIRKSNWIDFDCGTMVEGTDLSALSKQLFDHVLAVASGEKVKSEKAIRISMIWRFLNRV